MQQDSKWTSSPETQRSFMPLQSSYPYSNNEYSQHSNNNRNSTTLPGMSTQPPMSGIISGSQPGTPRPSAIGLPPDKTSVTPDLVRRQPPLPSRSASFTTTTFHSAPYPGSNSLRRRRTESSMFSFETGPSFNQTEQVLDLWNMDQSNGYQVQLNAKMDRGFFRADHDWTCYRRNYFQVSATFDVQGTNYVFQGPEAPCLVKTGNQEIHQVDFFSIGVSARVTRSDKKIELVQHTPKRDKGPQIVPEPRVVSAGGNLHLASAGANHNIVTFERMQFKTATANNGKRRAAQQYYEIIVSLYANTSSGKQLKVASCTSASLVVRGRSPGHYADSHTRYRESMDAGTPMSATFGPMIVGQGAPSGSTTTSSTVTESTPPSVSNATANGSEEHRYLHSQQQTRYGGPIANPIANGNGEFSNTSYPAYQQQAPGYPYQVGHYAPVIGTHSIGPGRSEDGGPSRDNGGYMVHPYPSHSLPSSQQQQHGSGGPIPNDVYNQRLPHINQRSSDIEPYNSRYNNDTGSHNNWSYANPEFGGYMRQSNDNNNNALMESNSIDAGRPLTPEDGKHYSRQRQPNGNPY